MATETTLLTSHKGVDLHAATAERVMRGRLDGGERLVALRRAEYYTFWEGDGDVPAVERLLETGRYFNPNKHAFGVFELADGDAPWHRREAECRGAALPAGWPGRAARTDLGTAGPGLLDRLLGGGAAPDLAVVDVCTFPLGETGPLLGGVLWRLVLRPGGADPAALADELAVARSGRRGLLLNPHMQGWLVAVRGGGASGAGESGPHDDRRPA